MNETKPVLASKTILSIVVTLVVVAYDLIGTQLGWPVLPDMVRDFLVATGLLLAGYGRVAATQRLGK